MLTRFLPMSWKIEGQTGNVVNNSDLQEVFAGSNPAHSTHLSSTEEISASWGQTGIAVSTSDFYEVFAGSNPAYSTIWEMPKKRRKLRINGDCRKQIRPLRGLRRFESCSPNNGGDRVQLWGDKTLSDNVFVPSHDRFGLGIEKVIDNAPLRLCACVEYSTRQPSIWAIPKK